MYPDLPTSSARERVTAGRQPVLLSPPPSGSAARLVAPLIDAWFPDGAPLRIEFWDGSALGPRRPAGWVRVLTPMAIRRLIWSPGELGFGRCFVTGEIDIEGDIVGVLDELEAALGDTKLSRREMIAGMRAARRCGAIGRPLPAPVHEAHPHGRLHSQRRDAEVVQHHYDVCNDFYGHVLGPTMTYSCARFTDRDQGLDSAQVAKLDLVCRKLGLHESPGQRLLDVGCGWGSLALHAAREYQAQVVGITISPNQADFTRAAVRSAGLENQVEIRLEDYRDLSDQKFDAIASIGMFEHVGQRRVREYFGILRRRLVPGGRLLNHAISAVGGTRARHNGFVGRYIFPDGELLDLGRVVYSMESAGFEVRDVECLREHYVDTLRSWVSNLEDSWSEAEALVGPPIARAWRLYMAASAVGFSRGSISLHQTLGIVPTDDGLSGMPRTRRGFS